MQLLDSIENISFIIDPPCLYIKVELKNNAKYFFGNLEGIYELSSSVNEQPSWVFAEYAIWHSPISERYKSGVWCIGPLNSLGTNFCWICTEYRFDVPYDESTEWKYVIFGKWWTSINGDGFNSVNVQQIKIQQGAY